MSPRDNIENKVKQFDVDVNPSRDEEIFNQLQKAMSKPKESKPDIRHEIWSIIMKNRIAKFVVASIISIVVMLPLAYGAVKTIKHFLVDDIRIVVKDSDKINTEKDAINAIQEFGRLYREGKAKEVKPGIWMVTLSNGEEFTYDGNDPEFAGLSSEEKDRLLKVQNEEIQKLRDSGNFKRTFIKEVEENGVKIRLYEDHFVLSSGKVVTTTVGEEVSPK